MELEPQVSDFAAFQAISYRARRFPTDPPAAYHQFQVRDLAGMLSTEGRVNFGADNLGHIVIPGGLRAGTFVLSIGAFDAAGDPVGGRLDTRFSVGAQTVPRVEVELVRNQQAAHHPLAGPYLTYQGFVDFLNDSTNPNSLNHDDQISAGSLRVSPGSPLSSPTPVFGAGPAFYDRLLDAARLYALRCECGDVIELYPTGYLEGRQADSTGWKPPVAPPDPVGGLPCIELIWNYWEEEGMLVQTLNHIVARFQNRRVATGDPLARLDVSPLLPLRSLLWSWAENENRRLTVRRRAAEYEFEYGLPLIGKALPSRNNYVERRSNFLGAFHTVLHLSTAFFKELDDLTITPDGFPLFEALRECHLVLSQGTQNSYGETAVQARAEMLVMQHILAQPQMREFLGGRPMTPYQEPWMDRVDSMKAIQGWSDASVMHFHDLATFGERLVLTIRLGNWNSMTIAGGQAAATWATGFRPVIQRYIAAYRAVTGVDLSKAVDATMPSTLIARRMQEARRRA